MPLLSSFAINTDMDISHPRASNPWPNGAYYQVPGDLSNPKLSSMLLWEENTKKLWSSKTSDEEREAHHPVVQLGKCISADMMTSLTPRLVAQMLGKPTCKRYFHAAIYFNQATGLGFVWHQKSVNLVDTMEGKTAFKRFCQSMDTIQHDHADNGIFASNSRRQLCLQQGQGLTFAGVTVHHQNGIAERQIKELQEMMHMMIIHVQQRWPSAITPNLWPYSLRMANNAINAMLNLKFEGVCESFSGTKVASNSKHWHLFGCLA